jgi:hypothetical protein
MEKQKEEEVKQIAENEAKFKPQGSGSPKAAS